jgi:hypothetical protein
MTDILSQASAIAADADRRGVIDQITALLESAPDGRFVFIFSAPDGSETMNLSVCSNASGSAALWMMGIAAQDIFTADAIADEDEGEDEDAEDEA